MVIKKNKDLIAEKLGKMKKKKPVEEEEEEEDEEMDEEDDEEMEDEDEEEEEEKATEKEVSDKKPKTPEHLLLHDDGLYRLQMLMRHDRLINSVDELNVTLKKIYIKFLKHGKKI